MKKNNIINREKQKIRTKIKERNFSQNTKAAIKNSSWQIATNLTAKIGSLLLTVILARLLLPEIYGLYGLALSTILLIGSISDLGLTSAVITFLSKKIDKKPGKAKGYFYQLTKYKIALLVIAGIVILLSASWIANNYYQKPIYYALLAGIIYLPMVSFSVWFGQIFQARNRFKPNFIREIILQSTKLVILPISVLYLIDFSSNNPINLFWLLGILSICYFLPGVYQFIKAKKEHLFEREKAIKLNKEEKDDLRKFILPLSITALSGVFFGYIDTIMLGRFVESSFIAYYKTAFDLALSAAAVIGFAGISLLPVFSRLKERELDRSFKQAKLITLSISTIALIFTFFFAGVIINVVYGPAYSSATLYLRLFSLLLLSSPLESLYQSYFTSQKKTKIISVALIISTILNIILNFFFIRYGLTFGMSQAVLGACIATITSRYFYLGVLMLGKNKLKKD